LVPRETAMVETKGGLAFRKVGAWGEGMIHSGREARHSNVSDAELTHQNPCNRLHPGADRQLPGKNSTLPLARGTPMVITITAKIQLPFPPNSLENKMAFLERANLDEMLDYAASTGRGKTIVRVLMTTRETASATSRSRLVRAETGAHAAAKPAATQRPVSVRSEPSCFTSLL
jgi:hypothetical protein